MARRHVGRYVSRTQHAEAASSQLRPFGYPRPRGEHPGRQAILCRPGLRYPLTQTFGRRVVALLLDGPRAEGGLR